MAEATRAFLAALTPEQRQSREFDEDFGRDLLRDHYRDADHAH